VSGFESIPRGSATQKENSKILKNSNWIFQTMTEEPIYSLLKGFNRELLSPVIESNSSQGEIEWNNFRSMLQCR
jgi:hypothetical protein